MSLAKLTSLSTQTLSLLLERQRLQSLSSFAASSTAATTAASATTTMTMTATSTSTHDTRHLPQITKNLQRLRSGILELEAKEGRQSEAVELLRSQYERMREMVRPDVDVESLDLPDVTDDSADSASGSSAHTPPPAASLALPASHVTPLALGDAPTKEQPTVYTPYTDDPEMGYEPSGMIQMQRRMMDEQDEHLDMLSHSINRQHHLSLQINEELDVHTGLLQELDTDLDHTAIRLSGARRRLDRVAKGARENISTVTIGLLILVLLILIIVFKT